MLSKVDYGNERGYERVRYGRVEALPWKLSID